MYGETAPPVADGESLVDLRDVLERADFTTERIETTLGVGELSAAAGETTIHRRRLAADDAFSTIARLFLLGDAVDASRVEAAFAPVDYRPPCSSPALRNRARAVRATARLLPHGDYHVASDHVAVGPTRTG